jgi:glycosyltransferase involved in cell wall biosynthesis
MTPIATNGLEHAPSELLLTGEGQELAELIVNLLKNDDRRNALGSLARSTAVQAFSWDKPASALSALLEKVVRKSNSTAAGAFLQA